MPDNKLCTPDSTALYDFIALIGACFIFHKHLLYSFAYFRYAFSPVARSFCTGRLPASSGCRACNLRRVLLTLSKLGRPRDLCCVIISARGIAPASFRQRLHRARYSTISSFLASSFFFKIIFTLFSMVLRFFIAYLHKRKEGGLPAAPVPASHGSFIFSCYGY